MKPLLLAVGIASASVSIAHAADAPATSAPQGGYNSWYFGIDAVLSHFNSTDVSGSSRGDIRYDSNFTLGDLKVGYRPQALYGENGAVRFEAELLGRSAKVDRVNAGGTSTKPKSDLNLGALMVNAYYDWHTGTAFTPYVGVGIGVAGAEFSKHPGLGITDKESTDTKMAGQLSVGVSYTPEFWPDTDWSIGYNYFRMGGPEFKTDRGHVTLDDVGVSSLQVGFKYHF